MNLNPFEILTLSSALLAALMLGSHHLRFNLVFYILHTCLISAVTVLIGMYGHEPQLAFVAVGILLIKALGIPYYLSWIMKHLQVESDPGTFLAAPIAMHLSILLMAVSYILCGQLPSLIARADSHIGATAAMSLLFTGVLMMLTRKLAITQVVGFLVLENGVYLFALTQTHGMPLMIEMGFLLEILVAVMIFGLITFNIKRSFEHIDVSQLQELRD